MSNYSKKVEGVLPVSTYKRPFICRQIGINIMAEGQFIAYYRVSTDRQGQSGLGLEAQQTAIMNYLNGGNWQLVGEYTEIETGKKADRPELQKALAACARRKATLVIAKLDRLARNVAFVSALMESRVEFVAVDMPNAGRFEIHIRAALAEEERRLISERTKAALAATKKRGTVLGKHGKDVLSKQNRQTALSFARHMKPVIHEIRSEGHRTVRAICEQLNRREIPTYRGNAKWHLRTVNSLLRRVDEL